MEPKDFTPEWIQSLGGTLYASCEKCRELRGVSLADLKRAQRFEQPVRDMKFRCKCGDLGTVFISWHDSTGSWSYDYATGVKAERSNPSIYHTR